MTRKQIALILVANAVISTVISIVVSLLLNRPQEITVVTSPTIELATTSAMTEQITSTPEAVVHVVAAGDTISGLAFQYDVPEAQIIAANNLENPNFLQVGMRLIIPVGGLSQVTATFTPAPTPSDTPIPFDPPPALTATASAAAGATAAATARATTTPLLTPLPDTGERQVSISEVLYPGDATQEQVVITNNGSQLADLLGWTLSDSNGNIYEFGNVRLWSAGSATVHTRVGQDGSPPTNYFWGKLEAIWSSGETATLKDAEGQVLSTFTVGP